MFWQAAIMTWQQQSSLLLSLLYLLQKLQNPQDLRKHVTCYGKRQCAPKVCSTLPAETDTSPADASQQPVEATEAAQNCPSAADVAVTVQHQSEWGESTSWQKLHSTITKCYQVLPSITKVKYSTSAWSLTLAQQHMQLQGHLHP